MTDIKFDKDKWLPRYRSNKTAVWIKCILTDGQQMFFDHFSGWLEIKELCEANNLFIAKLELQYRSHVEHVFSLDEERDCDGIYLIRSMMGELGGDCRQYYTSGILKDGKIDKIMWLVPELIVERKTSDDISECFEEAIIYNDQKKKNRKE
tara:strand:- start:799 stop:1251 length:453 start_codon:yes stop_codon:yes gene_type:complete